MQEPCNNFHKRDKINNYKWLYILLRFVSGIENFYSQILGSFLHSNYEKMHRGEVIFAGRVETVCFIIAP
jgi:hypothetical protein